jgi:hypothetical protein
VVQFQAWRRYVAHDYSYYSRLTQKPLAARVCSKDVGLEMSYGQLQASHGMGGRVIQTPL